MLVLFNSQNDSIHTFKTYGALYNHLENMERIRKRPKRIFAHHLWRRLLSFYRYICDQKRAPHLMAIFEQGLEQALRQAAGSSPADFRQPEGQRGDGMNGLFG